jgi:hypothetical protein
VTLPIVPGSQEARIRWRQPDGIGRFYRAPGIGIGAASVNADAEIAMPADRWTLFVRGPRSGPAVLFWSVLAVSLLASIGLGQIRLTPLAWWQWFLLSLGLTQVPIWVAATIVAWLLALGFRRRRGALSSNLGHDAVQVGLLILTLAALVGLFVAIERGLLGQPEMQIAGNRSSARQLRWYQDRAGETLPRPMVLSVPIVVYRLAMLAWALWLAQALLRWLRWGWDCYAAGGLWRPLLHRQGPPPVPPPGPPVPKTT